jgi:hypothetical protein
LSAPTPAARNTVMLVDQIDRDIVAGHARYRAVIDAAVRRARSIAGLSRSGCWLRKHCSQWMRWP